MSKSVIVALQLDSMKKHSALFKPVADAKQPAVTGFYLMKDAFKELGEPKKIALTVESV